MRIAITISLKTSILEPNVGDYTHARCLPTLRHAFPDASAAQRGKQKSSRALSGKLVFNPALHRGYVVHVTSAIPFSHNRHTGRYFGPIQFQPLRLCEATLSVVHVVGFSPCHSTAHTHRSSCVLGQCLLESTTTFVLTAVTTRVIPSLKRNNYSALLVVNSAR